jgi:hypothetical protein
MIIRVGIAAITPQEPVLVVDRRIELRQQPGIKMEEGMRVCTRGIARRLGRDYVINSHDVDSKRQRFWSGRGRSCNSCSARGSGGPMTVCER